MRLSTIYQALEHKPGLKKILGTTAIVAVYSLLNYFLRMHLPGVSNVDLRPQVVLLIVAGYLYGPWYGFIAGFAGNFCSDMLFGYGLRYLPSWTIGNGLIGALICFYPYRKNIRLDSIGQLVWLVLFLILTNVISLTYAAGMENILDSHLPQAINFRYFYVPALLSNVLGSLIFFPAILLMLGYLKKNYPVKLAMANYYLTVTLLVVSWISFIPSNQTFHALITSAGMDMIEGNALVDAFNYWALMFVMMLLLSFFISSWMSKTIISPLKQLENTVFAVLKGDPSSAERLAGLAGREDEIGILSYTVRLLSEKLWETQTLFRNELEKRMKFLDARDSGTDILVTALFSLFGRVALEDQTDVANLQTRELNKLSAICLIISASGLQELAATYSDTKIEKSLEGMDLILTDAGLSKQQCQAIALAIDVNLLFKGRLKMMDIHAPLSRELAFHLLERVQCFRKSSQNYIGYVTAPDIVGRILDKWEKAEKIRSKRLEEVMNRATGQFVITGYQIKNLRDLAQFDADLTIAYSHSDFQHIKQLIGLLMSETFQAKLQLEPKRSSFFYRDEWEKTADLHLEVLEGGKIVAHKDEFDLVMEFTDRDHRDRFRQIIDTYAKREFNNERKILRDSWYQPLYRLEVPVDGYISIACIIIQDETHIAYAYVKEDEAVDRVEWFKKELPDLKISTAAIWVNDAFFRYLAGGRD